MMAEIDRDDLPVDRNTVLVMRNCGPKGAPGFPEWGHIPMPKKLLEQGVTDMVRISDARMSGTSFGTVVLHVAPESAVGGPLAVVRTGDEIVLDVATRKLELAVAQEEIDAATARFRRASAALPARLWEALPGSCDPGQPRLRFRFPDAGGWQMRFALAMFICGGRFGQSLNGVIDIHAHSDPDSTARSIDAIDLAKLAKARGMRGLVLKNHYESTAALAYIVRKEVPGIEIFGGIDLNLTVGGINPAAVERMTMMKGGWGVWCGCRRSTPRIRCAIPKRTGRSCRWRRTASCCRK